MLIGLIPVFNEEKSIIEILNKLDRHVGCIIIVNDGSFDKTDFLISNWIKNRKNVYYLAFLKNRGMSYALLQGFNFIFEKYKKGEFSNEDVIITIDADGQHNPEDINNMYEYFNRNNLDVLIAQRKFSHYPKYRVIGNNLLSRFASWVGKFKFADIECGFKMLKVRFVKDLLYYYIGFRYSCAGEIGITASLLRYKLDNKYPIQVFYYRKRGPTFIDLFINLVFFLTIVSKIRFKKPSSILVPFQLNKTNYN